MRGANIRDDSAEHKEIDWQGVHSEAIKMLVGVEQQPGVPGLQGIKDYYSVPQSGKNAVSAFAKRTAEKSDKLISTEGYKAAVAHIFRQLWGNRDIPDGVIRLFENQFPDVHATFIAEKVISKKREDVRLSISVADAGSQSPVSTLQKNPPSPAASYSSVFEDFDSDGGVVLSATESPRLWTSSRVRVLPPKPNEQFPSQEPNRKPSSSSSSEDETERAETVAVVDADESADAALRATEENIEDQQPAKEVKKLEPLPILAIEPSEMGDWLKQNLVGRVTEQQVFQYLMEQRDAASESLKTESNSKQRDRLHDQWHMLNRCLIKLTDLFEEFDRGQLTQQTRSWKLHGVCAEFAAEHKKKLPSLQSSVKGVFNAVTKKGSTYNPFNYAASAFDALSRYYNRPDTKNDKMWMGAAERLAEWIEENTQHKASTYHGDLKYLFGQQKTWISEVLVKLCENFCEQVKAIKDMPGAGAEAIFDLKFNLLWFLAQLEEKAALSTKGKSWNAGKLKSDVIEKAIKHIDELTQNPHQYQIQASFS